MRDIWTNRTWADWLKSKGVPEQHYALLELQGNNLPTKVIATAKVGEDLFPKIPLNKRWYIAYWCQIDQFPVVGSLHPSIEFLEKHKKSLDRKRKKS